MLNSKKCKGIKVRLVILFLFALLANASAQQDPMFTQYMHNPMSINPAYAGSRGTVNAVMMNRQQWVGIDGAPNTMTLSVNSPFIDDKVGIGLSLIYDRIDPTRQLGLYTDYAYHLKVTEKVKFSLGLKGGFNMYDVNTLKLKGSQYENDPTVERMYLPNFGIGSYLYSDRFYLGLSVPKMLQNSLSDNENTMVNKEVRHYFFSGGYVFDIAENVRFKPTFTFRMVSGAPVSSEITGSVLLHDRLWLGAMYRHTDALGGMVKFDITSQLGMGYSYDSSLSRLGNYNKGTHEVYVSYDFTYKVKKSTPLFF